MNGQEVIHGAAPDPGDARVGEPHGGKSVTRTLLLCEGAIASTFS